VVARRNTEVWNAKIRDLDNRTLNRKHTRGTDRDSSGEVQITGDLKEDEASRAAIPNLNTTQLETGRLSSAPNRLRYSPGEMRKFDCKARRNASPSPEPALSALPSQLLERRSDIAEAERRMAAANEQIGIAKSAYYPALNLAAAVGLEGTSPRTGLIGQAGFGLLEQLFPRPSLMQADVEQRQNQLVRRMTELSQTTVRQC
jgi:hypothetical protein